jgi:hypothetical protein
MLDANRRELQKQPTEPLQSDQKMIATWGTTATTLLIAGVQTAVARAGNVGANVTCATEADATRARQPAPIR